MKVSKPPFSARAASQSTSMDSGCTTLPSKSVNVAPSARTSTIRPSSTGITVVVRPSTAGMSEARMLSPAPTPTTSGEATFTPTRRPGSSDDMTTSE